MAHHHLEESDHKPHILPLKVYFNVGFALILLTVLTVYTAKIMPEHIHSILKTEINPTLSLVIAFFIAFVKASLVCLFFMHLFYEKKFLLFTFFFGIFSCFIFFALTLSDTLERKENFIEIYTDTTPELFRNLSELPGTSFHVPPMKGYDEHGNKLHSK